MRRALLALSILSLAGCGSEEVTTVTTAPGPVPGAVQRTVLGRAQLDVPFQNATVTLQALDGTPLTTTTTDAAGTFQATLRTNEPAFRAVATNGTETYASEYATFDADSEQVVISPLTNMVAAYHQAHPELTLEASEAAVRRYLELPAKHDIHYHLVQTEGPGFHVGQYLTQARANPDFVARVVAAIDAPDPQIPNSLFTADANKQWEQEGVQLGVAVVTTILQANGIPFGALIGWAVNLIEGQAGGGGQFGALATALEKLAGFIDGVYKALDSDIQKVLVDIERSLLNEIIGNIKTQEGTFQTYLNSGASISQKYNLAANVTNTTFTQQSGQIYDGLAGTTGILHNFAHYFELSGVDYQSNRNSRISSMQKVYTMYAGYHTRLVRLIVEGYHSLPSPQPLLAQSAYDDYSYYIADESTYIPQRLDSDEVIYLPKTGLIFLRSLHENTYANATADARTFQEGGYRKWRVADRQDLYGLIQPDGPGTHKNGVKTLQDYHFDLALVSRDYPIVGQAGGELSFNLDNPDYPDFQPGWNHNRRPYFLVCNAKDQDPRLLPALTEIASLKISQEGNRLRALATVRGSDSIRSSHGYGSFQATDLDYTDLVSWQSTAPGVLRVQNPPSGATANTTPDYQPPITLGPGYLTWFSAGNAIVNATGRNPYTPNQDLVRAQVALSQPSVSPPSLQKLQVGPQGLLFQTSPSAANLSVVGFYSDGSALDLGPNVTFTTSRQEASVIYEPVPRQLQLLLREVPRQSNFVFTVTASVNGTTSAPLNVTVTTP